MDLLNKWNSAITNYPDLSLLRKAIWSGRIAEQRNQPPRSILWKVVLLYKTLDQQTWTKIDLANLKRFQEIELEYQKDYAEGISSISNQRQSSEVVETSDDPLSERLHETEEQLIESIDRDVDRTFPDIELFRLEKVQTSLKKMLYYYAKLNPEVGYRQGMHELLSPIYSVLDHDGVEQLEMDSFFLFEAIMDIAKAWYIPSSSMTQAPYIVIKSLSIQENIVRYVDPELYQLLVDNSIEPQLWGIRWIRLLFGREFSFDKMLCLWDGLFTVEDGLLELVDYVCAVMLLRVKPRLLECEQYTDMLTLLLNYNVTELDDSPYAYITNAFYLKRNTTLEGGLHLSKQYEHLWSSVSSSPDQKARKMFRNANSPRLNLESLVVDMAKSVSQKFDQLDIDRRFRDAFEETKRSFNNKSPLVRNGKARTATINDQRLADMLSSSLDILEKQLNVQLDSQVQQSLTTIRDVRDCLCDKRNVENVSPMIATPVKIETMDSISPPALTISEPLPLQREGSIPQPSLSTSTRSQKRTSLEKGEYSWILGDSGSTKSSPVLNGFKSNKPNSYNNKNNNNNSSSSSDNEVKLPKIDPFQL